MKYEIACVGRLKERYWQDAAGEYLRRLSRFGRFEIAEQPDKPAPEKLSSAQQQQLMQAEGELLLARLKPGTVGICLDGRGRELDSVAFSQMLAALEQQGKDVVFVIGGSLGLSPQVRQACEQSLSLGKMTYPHQIARILLLEQLYRAQKILHHEPYHK